MTPSASPRVTRTRPSRRSSSSPLSRSGSPSWRSSRPRSRSCRRSGWCLPGLPSPGCGSRLERATALEQDELELELIVASERPIERLELLLGAARRARDRLGWAGAVAASRLGGRTDDRAAAPLCPVGELRDRRTSGCEHGTGSGCSPGRRGSTSEPAFASTRSRRRCARSSHRSRRSRSRATRSRGRRVKGSSSPTCASSQPATASARSTGGRAPAATCSSSTSGIPSGTPT